MNGNSLPHDSSNCVAEECRCHSRAVGREGSDQSKHLSSREVSPIRSFTFGKILNIRQACSLESFTSWGWPLTQVLSVWQPSVISSWSSYLFLLLLSATLPTPLFKIPNFLLCSFIIYDQRYWKMVLSNKLVIGFR